MKLTPILLAGAALGGALVACNASRRPPEVVPSVPVASLPGHASLAEDTAPKEEGRLVPPEAYLRTYLKLFGGVAPLDAQKTAREGGLFDSWDDYFAALGFPDYRIDFPRSSQSNAMMMATFERLGVALCDRAVEHDLKGKPATPLQERRIFRFDLAALGAGAPDDARFAVAFDGLHRTFLGYPARLAETDRVARFRGVYDEIVRRHSDKGAPRSRFTPAEAGWAAVCYGLVRHPEFHLY
jgi:hypothetical protein